MNAVHPVFASTLAAFSGQQRHAVPHKVMVPVETFEVELSSDNPSDAETWRTVQPSDQDIQTAAVWLLNKYGKELYDAVTLLCEGKKLP